MERQNTPAIPLGYSYATTGIFFALGGLVTAVFSGSLAVLARHAALIEVLAVGMIVPSFTWVVQLSASGFCLGNQSRQLYWGDLARVCLLGSIALLPAAIFNLVALEPPLWISVANVLLSVVVMAVELFRRSANHELSLVWPISWCLTITLNMTLFVLSSLRWW